MNIYELIIGPDREDHIARHHVTVEEVEEVVFLGTPVIRRTRQPGRGQRFYRLVGQTKAGRYLTIFIAPRGRWVFGLVTARDSTAAERTAYQERRRH